MRGKDREALIVKKTAYKAIYFSNRMDYTQPAEIWIEKILREEIIATDSCISRQ